MRNFAALALTTLALILSPIASGDAFVGRHLVRGSTSTATAAGTTTLTVASNYFQQFTGSTTQTVVLPNATTMKVGMAFLVSNDSSGTVTVNYNGGSGAATLLAGQWSEFVLKAAGSAAGTWDVNGSPGLSVARASIAAGTASHVVINDGSGNLSSEASLAVTRGGTGAATLTANNVLLGNGTSAVAFVAPGSSGNVLQSNGTTWISSAPGAATYTLPKVTKYTSGSGTFTVTGTPLYLRVLVVGGGGGGGPSGTAGGGNAGNGVASSFGTSLLTANGGVGGIRTGNAQAGGSFTVNSPAVDVRSRNGGPGQGPSVVIIAGQATFAGTLGGTNCMGGFAGPSEGNTAGSNGMANTGQGGQGGGTQNAGAANYAGSGGGAGACVDAIVPSPTGTYAYVVGAGGTAGTAGTNGRDGGAGGSGYVEVIEYYQ